MTQPLTSSTVAVRRHVAAHLLAAGWFCLLAVISSYPLAFRLTTALPGTGPGDNVSFLWNFWWFRKAFDDPALAAFETAYLFAPFGTSLVLHTHTALEAAIGATLLRPLPCLTAHNVVLLAGLMLNGIGTYALAYHEIRRVAPAILAGTVFASSTYIAIHLLGHFNLVHSWVIPTAALAWILFVERPTPSRAGAVGIAFAAVTYSDYYYTVFVALFAAAWYALQRTPCEVHRRAGDERLPRIEQVCVIGMSFVAIAITAILITGGFELAIGGSRISASSIRNPIAVLWLLLIAWGASRIRVVAKANAAAVERTHIVPSLAVGAVLYLVLVLPLASAALRMIWTGDYVSPPLQWRSGPRGIDLATLVLGNPLHPWYGDATRSAYARLGVDMMEQAAWIGLVPAVLLLLAITSDVWTDDRWRRWAWIATIFFVWALGSYLVIGGHDTGAPLPHLVTRLIPVVSNARVPGRAIVMVQIALSILTAMYVAKRAWPPPAIFALILVALLDSAAIPFPMYEASLSRAIDSDILASSGGTVLELPAGIRDGFGQTGTVDHRSLIHQTVHGRPIVGGFVARLSPIVKAGYGQLPEIQALMLWPEQQIGTDLKGELRRAGVEYVVVNADAIARPIGPILQDGGLRLVATEGTREVYAVD